MEDAELREQLSDFTYTKKVDTPDGWEWKKLVDLDEVLQLIKARDAAKEREADFKLVLFGAELGYCLANGLPVGEGHTPPSFVYESMEGTVEKWLSKRRESDQEQKHD